MLYWNTDIAHRQRVVLGENRATMWLLMHNLSFQGTAGKLCLPVRSALRAPAPPELKR